MLKIVVPATEQYDEATSSFISTKECTLNLEHSLLSLSKWEAKWNVPFLGSGEKTTEQVLDYIKCMTTNQVDPNVYSCLTPKNIEDITNYINAPMTATTFSERDGHAGRAREVVTSELIYYWMVASQIPFECQKWHLNRLLTLVRICSIKNAPSKKMGKKATMSQNAALNAARRKRLHSSG